MILGQKRVGTLHLKCSEAELPFNAQRSCKPTAFNQSDIFSSACLTLSVHRWHHLHSSSCRPNYYDLYSYYYQCYSQKDGPKHSTSERRCHYQEGYSNGQSTCTNTKSSCHSGCFLFHTLPPTLDTVVTDTMAATHTTVDTASAAPISTTNITTITADSRRTKYEKAHFFFSYVHTRNGFDLLFTINVM
jgi:hypothetical protein